MNIDINNTTKKELLQHLENLDVLFKTECEKSEKLTKTIENKDQYISIISKEKDELSSENGFLKAIVKKLIQ